MPGDNAFGAWLGQNGHDHVNKDDRAALINMTSNFSLARIMLEETGRSSYQLIWLHEMKSRYLSAKKPTSQVDETSENAATASTTALASVSAPAESDENQERPSSYDTCCFRMCSAVCFSVCSVCSSVSAVPP
jgi:hypothetical protein